MDDDIDVRTARYVAEELAATAVAYAENPQASVLVIKRMAYVIVGRERSDEQSQRELMEWLANHDRPRETTSSSARCDRRYETGGRSEI